MTHEQIASNELYAHIPILRIPPPLITSLVELFHTLCDCVACADFPGHLQAWWEVTCGEVSPDDPAPAY